MPTIISKRVDRLEVVQALENRMKADKQKTLSDGFGRAFHALRAALPSDPQRTVRVSPGVMRVVVDRDSRSFEEKLCALHDRMQAGAMTEEDHAVVASVPPDALDATGVNLEQYIAIMVKGYRLF